MISYTDASKIEESTAAGMFEPKLNRSISLCVHATVVIPSRSVCQLPVCAQELLARCNTNTRISDSHEGTEPANNNVRRSKGMRQ